MELNWNQLEDIIEMLEEYYGNEDIPESNLLYLKEMITSLPDFADWGNNPTKKQLEEILEGWINLRSSIEEEEEA
ncbi:MAG TPA: Fe-S cluster assembly protein IscX [Candidatus Megaira endosymbiont of Hartmannula sinica]|nr:Fe-S cluster assembly protein IscX [Candidatus Megaera endosymbiont of Hartmannula sinica]